MRKLSITMLVLFAALAAMQISPSTTYAASDNVAITESSNDSSDTAISDTVTKTYYMYALCYGDETSCPSSFVLAWGRMMPSSHMLLSSIDRGAIYKKNGATYVFVWNEYK